MPDTPDLTMAFIKKRPESAGRVLAAMRPAVAAAFLQSIPTRFAVEAVAHMNPRPASVLVTKMGVTSGAALVRDLSFAEASAILRQIDPAVRNQLLEELPRRLRRDFEMSLAFPTDTVGAHMTTAIVTLSENDKTSDALELIKQMEGDHADVILVVNDKHKLVGAVTVTKLLRHPHAYSARRPARYIVCNAVRTRATRHRREPGRVGRLQSASCRFPAW